MDLFNDDERPVYRSVATHYQPDEAQQLSLDEFGSTKDFGYQSHSNAGAVGYQKSAFSKATHKSISGSSPYGHSYTSSASSASATISPKPQPFTSLSVSHSHAHTHAPSGYQSILPPKLFDSYYDPCYSFESVASPDEIMAALEDVLQSIGCDITPMPSESKIKVTHFLNISHISCEANIFTKGDTDDLYLVEINRLEGCCMKFHTFYVFFVTALCDSPHAQLFREIPENTVDPSTSSSSSSSQRSPRRSTHSSSSAAAVPSRPNLRRSPSSAAMLSPETGGCSGLRRIPVAATAPSQIGPTKLSRDLLTSLIAFCRSKCFEQQRDGLELLARLSGEPTNKGAVVRYAHEILSTVAALLKTSRDCGIQYSACALVAHVLAASGCDVARLFPSRAERAAAASNSSCPEDAAAEEVVDPKKMFSSISGLLFGKSRHVRVAASHVLEHVATESGHPELVNSKLYLEWLRQEGTVRARGILRRLGAQ